MQDREKELQDKIKELQEQNEELQEEKEQLLKELWKQISVSATDSVKLNTALEERDKMEKSIVQKRKELEEREETLRSSIFELEEALGDGKWLRVKRTFGVLSAGIYLIAFMSQFLDSIEDYLSFLIIAPFTAGFLMFIAWLILSYISAGALAKTEDIATRKGELNAIIDFKRKLK